MAFAGSREPGDEANGHDIIKTPREDIPKVITGDCYFYSSSHNVHSLVRDQN